LLPLDPQETEKNIPAYFQRNIANSVVEIEPDAEKSWIRVTWANGSTYVYNGSGSSDEETGLLKNVT